MGLSYKYIGIGIQEYGWKKVGQFGLKEIAVGNGPLTGSVLIELRYEDDKETQRFIVWPGSFVLQTAEPVEVADPVQRPGLVIPTQKIDRTVH